MEAAMEKTHVIHDDPVDGAADTHNTQRLANSLGDLTVAPNDGDLITVQADSEAPPMKAVADAPPQKDIALPTSSSTDLIESAAPDLSDSVPIDALTKNAPRDLDIPTQSSLDSTADTESAIKADINIDSNSEPTFGTLASHSNTHDSLKVDLWNPDSDSRDDSTQAAPTVVHKGSKPLLVSNEIVSSKEDEFATIKESNATDTLDVISTEREEQSENPRIETFEQDRLEQPSTFQPSNTAQVADGSIVDDSVQQIPASDATVASSTEPVFFDEATPDWLSGQVVEQSTADPTSYSNDDVLAADSSSIVPPSLDSTLVVEENNLAEPALVQSTLPESELESLLGGEVEPYGVSPVANVTSERIPSVDPLIDSQRTANAPSGETVQDTAPPEEPLAFWDESATDDIPDNSWLGETAQEVGKDNDSAPAALQVEAPQDDADMSWLQASAPDLERKDETDKTDPKEPIEHNWSKAFEDDDLDASWGAAFGDDMDDEGFLDEHVAQSFQAPLPTQVDRQEKTGSIDPAMPAASAALAFPQANAMPQVTTTQNPLVSRFAYSPNTALQSATPQEPPAKPKDFFAELPVAQRTKKSQRPVLTPQPSMSVLRPQQGPPPGTQPPSSAAIGILALPPQQNIFHTQPSTPPPTSQSSTSPPVPSHSATMASRYSPKRDTLQVTQQSLAPPSHQTPSLSETIPQPSVSNAPPRGKSPYAAPGMLSRKQSYAKMPPPKSSAPPVVSSTTTPQLQKDVQSQTAAPTFAPSMSRAASAYGIQDVPNDAVPPLSVNRFAPRTSSPLARFDRGDGNSMISSSLQQTPAPHFSADNVQDLGISAAGPPNGGVRYNPASTAQSDYRRSPVDTRHPPPPQAILPGSAAPRPQIPQRSTSQMSITSATVPIATQQARQPSLQHSFQEPNFVIPENETVHDPLQRWKGAPIFRWGPTGSAVICRPAHVPVYGGGQGAPRIKSLPGQPRVRRLKDMAADDTELASFPSSLRSKSKKKEVLSWLSTMITRFEEESTRIATTVSSYEANRAREKVILWSCAKILVENDGVLAGNPVVDATVRQVLTPPSTDEPALDPKILPVEGQDQSIIVAEIKKLLKQGDRAKAVWHAVDHRLWAHAMLISSTLEPKVWQQVAQEFILKDVRTLQNPNHSLAALYQVFAGDWEDCIDQLVPVSARSGFQMVSTADRASQPRDAIEGLNKWQETLSLILSNRSKDDENAIASLGRLLASYGRIEASHVCFLFARSALRFGGVDDPQTNLVLLGFDHKSPDTVLGLESILLTEVYEFSQLLSGSREGFVAPHLQVYKLRHAYALAEFGFHGEALQVCEALTASLKSTTRMSPYYHAAMVSGLDDLQKRLNQSPKDGTTSWISRPTIGKVSSSMGTWLTNFVAGDETEGTPNSSGFQSDVDAGPFTRNLGGTPSMSRSTSVTDLNALYAQAGNSRYAPAMYGARPPEQEPGAPTYGSYSSSPEQRITNYAPRASLEAATHGSPAISPGPFTRQPSSLSQTQIFPSRTLEHKVSEPHSSYSPSPNLQTPSRPHSSNDRSTAAPDNGFTRSYSPSFGSYQPPSAIAEEPAEVGSPSSPGPTSRPYANGKPYETVAPPQQFGYEPPTASYEPDPESYHEDSSTYEPPQTIQPNPIDYRSSSAGYDPYASNYAPQTATPTETFAQEGGTSKSTLHDDDPVARAAALDQDQRSQRDRDANEAFKKAAEADAERDKAAKEKRSSSSGWFGGFWKPKDPNAPQVHKAKLGEASSFYYDKETKRWVNKNADPSATSSTSSTPPPPPRSGPPSSAPPSRNVSAMSLPAAGPPAGQRLVANGQSKAPPTGSMSNLHGTPLSQGGFGDDFNRAQGLSRQSPPGPSDAASAADGGPPSRPPTSMSNVSTIDDLLGGPATGRKAGAPKKGRKKAGYVDILAK